MLGLKIETGNRGVRTGQNGRMKVMRWTHIRVDIKPLRWAPLRVLQATLRRRVIFISLAAAPSSASNFPFYTCFSLQEKHSHIRVSRCLFSVQLTVSGKNPTGLVRAFSRHCCPLIISARKFVSQRSLPSACDKHPYPHSLVIKTFSVTRRRRLTNRA